MNNIVPTLVAALISSACLAQPTDTTANKRKSRVDISVGTGLSFNIWRQLSPARNHGSSAASPAFSIGADYFPEANGKTSVGLHYHLLTGQAPSVAFGSNHMVHMISSGYKVHLPTGNSGFSLGPVIGYAWYREKGTGALYAAPNDNLVRGAGMAVGAAIAARHKIGSSVFLCIQVQAMRFQYSSTVIYRTSNKLGSYDEGSFPLSYAEAILLPSLSVTKTL